jgi:hypothetical protein
LHCSSTMRAGVCRWAALLNESTHQHLARFPTRRITSSYL